MGNDYSRETSWTEKVNGHDTQIKEYSSNKTKMNLLTGGATAVGTVGTGYALHKLTSETKS